MIEENEKRRFGPMQIIEDDDERTFGGKGLEETTHRWKQGDGASRFRSKPHRPGDLAEGPSSVIALGEQVMKCPPPTQACCFDHSFAKRKERTFAVCRTSLRDHVRIGAERGR